jgi:sigma-B regulation protein RsbU (phosphoserine phosphatase)
VFKSVASRLIFWIAGTTAVLFTVGTVYSYRAARDQAIRDAQRRAVLIAESQARLVEEVLHSAEEGARLLATTLGHTTATNEELENVIRAFVEGNPRVYGSTAAANPETRGLYAPYFYRGATGIARADLATEAYDYPRKEWYTSAASAGEPRWSEPYFDEGGGNVLMVTYTVPVFTDGAGDGRFVGVVTADIALEWLADLIESQGLGGSAYALVFSRRGQILAHPDPSMLMTAVASVQEDGEAADPRAREIVAKMLRGEEGFEPFDDNYLGKRARAVFRPVGGAGWSFAVVYVEDELLAEVRRLATLDFAILVAVLVALTLVVSWVSRRLTRPLRELSTSAARIATGDLDLALPPVQSDDEVGALTSSFHHMRDSLKEYIHNLEVTTKAKERLESELEIARKIQMDMLPPNRAVGGPPAVYELAASLVPARQVGGDLYDHFTLGGKIWFIVGDVSGKGVGAALFMARAKTMIRAVAHPKIDLADVLNLVNRGLCEQNEQGMFVTLFAGVLDPVSGELTYGGAGHDPPAIVSGTNQEPRFMDVDGGPVLGLIAATEYKEQRAQLERGDTVVVYTDGVTEGLNEKGEFFTAGRILSTLATVPKQSTSAILGALLDALHGFVGKAPQSDDITVMAVRYSTISD